MLLPDVDADTRTLPVRFVVDNRSASSRPECSCRSLSPARDEAQLVVPSEAVIVTGERPW